MILEVLLALVLLVSLIVGIYLKKLINLVKEEKIDPDTVKGVFATSLKDLGIDKDIGSIKVIGEDIKKASRDLQGLFEVKRGRAEWGEFQLEELLSDSFPKDKFGIRKNLKGIGTPDAYIESTDGIICIDCKFPLDNYRKMNDAQDEREREKYGREFAKDVQRHIDKIKEYIKPEYGTAPIAFGFIPSEAVYQYITEACYDLLKRAAEEGVNLLSPSTLIVNLNLIKIGIRAQFLTEKAKEIEDNLKLLDRGFEQLEVDWGKLQKHIIDAHKKSFDVYTKISKLKGNYERIAKIEEYEGISLPASPPKPLKTKAEKRKKGK